MEKMMNLFNMKILGDLTQYKLYLTSTNNDGVNPLEVFLYDKERWETKWINYKTKTNNYNRPYVFTCVKLNDEKNVYLFTGIYEVLNYKDKDLENESSSYKLKLTNRFYELIGKLKLKIDFASNGQVRFNLENQVESLYIYEILKESYTQHQFPGINNIRISFKNLKRIIEKNISGWRMPLENIGGIYLINDCLTGKMYVGQTAGKNNFWGRWKAYIETYTGGDVEFKKLFKNESTQYFEENLYFSVLEVVPSKEKLYEREQYWKDILLSRKFGYNDN